MQFNCKFSMACFSSAWSLFIFAAIAVIPIAFFAYTEHTAHLSGSISYTSSGWFSECAKWDPHRRRFLVSTFSNTVSEIREGEEEEGVFVSDPDLVGNCSLGLVVDEERKRVLVVFADAVRFRYSALAAYDLDTGERFFLTRLAGPGDEPSMADDVAVDVDGNAFITDAKSNKLWKVGGNGELLSVIRNQAFVQRKEWYHNVVGLNGIVYHPDGYLLIIHTSSGQLFKFDTMKEEVKVVNVNGSLLMGDGLELISPTKLVVAGSLASARLVESSDDWETGVVTARYMGPLHRVASSATVKDGSVYINHLVGNFLTKRTHIIAKANFIPVYAK